MASTKTIDSLPDEVILEIFQYLKNEELVSNTQHVSARWRLLVHDIRLWKDYTFAPPESYKTKKVVKLLTRMPRLKSFVFHKYLDIRDVINALCCHCKELTSLKSSNVPGMTPDIWVSLRSQLPNIESLWVHPATLALEANFLSTFPNLKKLKCLHSIEHSQYSYYGNPINNEKGCKNLEELEIMTNVHNFALVEKIITNNLCSLVNLKLYCIPPSLLALVPKCQNLESLSLNFMSRRCEDFRKILPLVGKLNNLKRLSLRQFAEYDMEVLCLLFADGNLPSLIELDLRHCQNMNERVALSIARCCPRLQILRVQGSPVLDDACIDKLTGCQQLEYLDISGCIRLTNVSLTRIGKLKHLHTLNYSWVGDFNRQRLECLSASSNLRKLYLDKNGMTESDVVALVRSLPKLVYLSVYQCPEIDPAKLQPSSCRVKISGNETCKVLCPYAQ